jgi:hypothetical protein
MNRQASPSSWLGSKEIEIYYINIIYMDLRVEFGRGIYTTKVLPHTHRTPQRVPIFPQLLQQLARHISL